MFEEGEKLYYIDTNDGVIQEAKFIESNSDGIWIRIKGHSINTFVYSDSTDERVFKDLNRAEIGLENLKSKIKARLLKDDSFIKDIVERLRKNEGELYLSIIREILYEKTGLPLKSS